MNLGLANRKMLRMSVGWDMHCSRNQIAETLLGVPPCANVTVKGVPGDHRVALSPGQICEGWEEGG